MPNGRPIPTSRGVLQPGDPSYGAAAAVSQKQDRERFQADPESFIGTGGPEEQAGATPLGAEDREITVLLGEFKTPYKVRYNINQKEAAKAEIRRLQEEVAPELDRQAKELRTNKAIDVGREVVGFGAATAASIVAPETVGAQVLAPGFASSVAKTGFDALILGGRKAGLLPENPDTLQSVARRNATEFGADLLFGGALGYGAAKSVPVAAKFLGLNENSLTAARLLESQGIAPNILNVTNRESIVGSVRLLSVVPLHASAFRVGARRQAKEVAASQTRLLDRIETFSQLAPITSLDMFGDKAAKTFVERMPNTLAASADRFEGLFAGLASLGPVTVPIRAGGGISREASGAFLARRPELRKEFEALPPLRRLGSQPTPDLKSARRQLTTMQHEEALAVHKADVEKFNKDMAEWEATVAKLDAKRAARKAAGVGKIKGLEGPPIPENPPKPTSPGEPPRRPQSLETADLEDYLAMERAGTSEPTGKRLAYFPNDPEANFYAHLEQYSNMGEAVSLPEYLGIRRGLDRAARMVYGAPVDKISAEARKDVRRVMLAFESDLENVVGPAGTEGAIQEFKQAYMDEVRTYTLLNTEIGRKVADMVKVNGEGVTDMGGAALRDLGNLVMEAGSAQEVRELVNVLGPENVRLAARLKIGDAFEHNVRQVKLGITEEGEVMTSILDVPNIRSHLGLMKDASGNLAQDTVSVGKRTALDEMLGSARRKAGDVSSTQELDEFLTAVEKTQRIQASPATMGFIRRVALSGSFLYGGAAATSLLFNPVVTGKAITTLLATASAAHAGGKILSSPGVLRKITVALQDSVRYADEITGAAKVAVPAARRAAAAEAIYFLNKLVTESTRGPIRPWENLPGQNIDLRRPSLVQPNAVPRSPLGTPSR